jgi:phosphoglycerate kinase
MKLRSIRQAKNLKNKKVLYRVDYNFTLEKKGRGWAAPRHHRRFLETLPTIKYLLKQGCSLVFLSWLKRPNGKVVEQYRMDPVARELANLTNRPVTKVDDCVGPEVQDAIAKLKPQELLMLENVRFHPEEMEGDSQFAKELTKGLDLVVFDAFAQSHRDKPSTTGIMKYLPSYAGFLLENEVKHLQKVTKNPKKPFTIILGGAKISDKINVMRKLIPKADYVLIGGGLANIFFKANNISVGASYVEDIQVSQKSKVKSQKYFIQKAKEIFKNNNNIVLPIDMLAASKMNSRAKTKIIDISAGEKINKNWMFLDIGPKTIKKYNDIIKKSKTILWNGPVGVFEINKFAHGTKMIALTAARSKAICVLGGGDTEGVIRKYHLEGQFTHVSTGGGAMLKFLEGKILPAIKPLIKKT